MDSNKENIQPKKPPKVRVEEVNLNGSDEESDKGEWAVVYDDSDVSISSEKHDIAQKNDENDTSLTKTSSTATNTTATNTTATNTTATNTTATSTTATNTIATSTSPSSSTQYSITYSILPETTKTNKNDHDNETLDSYVFDEQNNDNVDKIFDEIPNDCKVKQFIDLKDLHNFGLKIEQLSFSDDSSDIDIIDEETSFDLLSPGFDARSEMSVSLSSVVSQYSSMTAIREHFLEQIAKQEFAKQKRPWIDNDSDLGEADCDKDADNKARTPIRAYVHQRNAVLNGKLTLILVLSITAVVGLGIGHFIGWSNHWQLSHRLSMSQVIKLKQLQDDLLVCMRIQNEADFETNGFQHIPFKEVCYRDFDYWKNRFETFFEENKGMMELFQRTQKRFHDSKDKSSDENFEYVSEKECVNKTTSEEFNKLELNFLVRQMEHLNMLEVLEQVKKSEKQVKDLRKENEGLKKKLEEEEQDDEMIEKEWNTKVTQLQEQNQELVKSIVNDEEEDRKTIEGFEREIFKLTYENSALNSVLDQLIYQTLNSKHTQNDVNHDSVDKEHPEIPISDQSYLGKFIFLKDQINQLMTENQEMKANVAKYRWSDLNQETNNIKTIVDQKLDIFRAKYSILKHQLELEHEESKRWKNNFENVLKKLKKSERERNPKVEHEEKYKFSEESSSLKHKGFFINFYGVVEGKLDDLNKKYKKKLAEALQRLSSKFEINQKIREQGDRLVRFGHYLEVMMEKVHNYSEKLLEKGLNSKIMSFFSEKITDLSQIIEKKFLKKQNDKQEDFGDPFEEFEESYSRGCYRNYGEDDDGDSDDEDHFCRHENEETFDEE